MDRGPDMESQYNSCFFLPCNICQNIGNAWGYVFIFFPCEGWLHSACTHADKRSWTALKAVSVSLSKSLWQTWSSVGTDGTCKWDLFADGWKGSLVWPDFHRELLASLAVTHLHMPCKRLAQNLSFLQAVFPSWRHAAFVHRVLPGAPATSAALALLLRAPWATCCAGGSHKGWAGRKAAVTVTPLLMFWGVRREVVEGTEATFPCQGA